MTYNGMTYISTYLDEEIPKKVVRNLRIHPAYFRIYKRYEGRGFDFFVADRYAEIVFNHIYKE